MTYHHYQSLTDLAKQQDYNILLTSQSHFLAVCKISNTYCIVAFHKSSTADYLIEQFTEPECFTNQSEALKQFTLTCKDEP